MKNTKTAFLLQAIPIVTLLTFITSSFFGENNITAFIIFSLSWMALSFGLVFGIAGVSWMRKARTEGEKGRLYIAGWVLCILDLLIGLLTIITFAVMLTLSV